ncbi:Predicted arabinose efflux permease, MFS family [Tistlia consotensis]|uniref:Predicted arabinose efflux permease, MFS family n=1 Tax=Tistlia consotensis USBA 355 TaxID=560819 RepID=A0A1Y6BQG6_9PROT|nr:MFS transporter [Tistlia consotensis]SMF23679.1 Predicted arabinose efflux permease, MFS family [Tistlia consotensis USBA 355]SNR61377.1 Predicted arabinose efflux permease, MFS family [Tistlia consotensis]
MRSLVLSVAALILSFSMLLAGNGLQFVVLALRAGLEGFSLEAMGWINAGYFAGFALGALCCPRLVAGAGHIRTFAALGSIVSGVALAHPLLVDPVAWALFRVVTGFCFAGLYLVVESWLNERASNELRGRLLALYGTFVFAGYALGPLLAGLGSAAGFQLFVLASMLVSFALVPVTLTRASAPVVGDEAPAERFGLRRLARETPLGFGGLLLLGAVQGAFIGLGPVFADRLELPSQWVSGFLTAGMLAGLVLQYPLGWLSDRLDRRVVIMLIAGCSTTLSALFLGAVLEGHRGVATVLAGAMATGGTIFPLYAIVLALINDRLPKTSLVSAAATISLLYSIGSSLGSPVASRLMAGFGPAGLPLFIGAGMAALALFAGWRMIRREAPTPLEDAQIATTVASPGAVPLEANPQDAAEGRSDT